MFMWWWDTIASQKHFPFILVSNPPLRELNLVALEPVRVFGVIAKVGNSSAGIRECSYLGVPVVDIGSRQFGRERASNVVWVPHDRDQIAAAIERQVEQPVAADRHGPAGARGRLSDDLYAFARRQRGGALCGRRRRHLGAVRGAAGSGQAMAQVRGNRQLPEDGKAARAASTACRPRSAPSRT